MQKRLGILVGMQMEAKFAAYLQPAAIEASGATREGAEAALKRLLAADVDAILSFGLAAGLDPMIKAGSILLPHSIFMENRFHQADPALRLKLGAEDSKVRVGALYHSDTIITSVQEKQAIFRETGCIAADMESGLVAQLCQEKKLPFAVLRVVCDSAERELPPLVNMALTQNGTLAFTDMMKSLFTQPSQVKELVKVGMDMGLACWHLSHFVRTQ